MYSKTNHINFKKLVLLTFAVIFSLCFALFESVVFVSADSSHAIKDDVGLLSDTQEREIKRILDLVDYTSVCFITIDENLNVSQYDDYLKNMDGKTTSGLYVGINMFNGEHFFRNYVNGKEQYGGVMDKEWLEIIIKNATSAVSDNAHVFFSEVAIALAGENFMPFDIPFTDVSNDAWYYNDVKSAYIKSLINGRTDTRFAPNENITFSEVIKLAACMHQSWVDGDVTLEAGKDVWYLPYWLYVGEVSNVFGDLNAKEIEAIARSGEDANNIITRKDYMDIFATVMPTEALKEINYVPEGSIPDVSQYSDGIYTLYRAGIVRGVNDNFDCNPNANITRAEVAAVLTRIMTPSERLSFNITGEKSGYDEKITDNHKYIKVNNIMEFVKAVGDNTTIEIPIDGFVISSDDKDAFTDELTQFFDSPSNLGNLNVRWEYCFDGYELIISNVTNLTIVGNEIFYSSVVTEPRYAFVFTFENCDNLYLEYLNVGHTPNGECDGGVFKFVDCRNIGMNECYLYGCGTEGIVLDGVDNFNMTNSFIYDCTYNLMTIRNSKNITFSDSIFTDTMQFHMVVLNSVENLLFENCVFRDNYAEDSAMFFTSGRCRNIVIKECKFYDNKVANLNVGNFPVRFDDCTFMGNWFEDSYEFNYPVG